MVNRYFIYKHAMLREADRLVQAQVVRDREDIFFLTFEELHEVVRTNQRGWGAHPATQGRLRVVSVAQATPGAHLGW